jgi:outer membrane protein TolC
VTGVFFSILLIDRQKEMLTTYTQLIDKRLSSMKSGVENGVLLRSDIDVMMSEKIKIEQQITEIDLKKASLTAVLSDLTGEELGTDSKLMLPGISDDITGEIARPELKVYDLRIEQLEAGKGLLNTRRLPKAFGFATLGYGAPPGNNLFENELSPYYIVGAGIKWNIYDWGKVKNEKQQLAIQQVVLRGRKADLNDNIKRNLQTKESEIASLAESLKRDSELINLRKRITASAESRYENGTITATELLGEMNAEKQAEISYEMHKISLEMAKIEYMNIIGRELD